MQIYCVTTAHELLRQVKNHGGPSCALEADETTTSHVAQAETALLQGISS